MNKPKLCFIPTNYRALLSLQALPGILPDVALQAPAFDDGTLGDDKDESLREFVAESAAVIPVVTGEPVDPQARRSGWAIAQQLGKPMMLLLVQGERKDVPAELAHLPLLDLVPLLQAFAGLDESSISTPNPQREKDCSDFRDALYQAIESQLPVAERTEMEAALRRVDLLKSSPSPEHALAALGQSAHAYARALEIGSPSMRRAFRARAFDAHHALATSLLGENNDNMPNVEPAVLDQWEEGCLATDWAASAIRLRLVRLARCHASFTDEEALAQTQAQWALANHPDHVESLGGLVPVFKSVLMDMAQRFIERANKGDVVEAGEGLDGVAVILEELPDYDALQYVLSSVAQVRSVFMGEMLTAVRCMEKALRVLTEDYNVELRRFTLHSGDIVRDRLEQYVQQLIEAWNHAKALEMVHVLIRLCRALPDQTKLAESLACYAYVSGELKANQAETQALIQEARHLVTVHHLDHLNEMMAPAS